MPGESLHDYEKQEVSLVWRCSCIKKNDTSGTAGFQLFFACQQNPNKSIKMQNILGFICIPVWYSWHTVLPTMPQSFHRFGLSCMKANLLWHQVFVYTQGFCCKDSEIYFNVTFKVLSRSQDKKINFMLNRDKGSVVWIPETQSKTEGVGNPKPNKSSILYSSVLFTPLPVSQ